jgi:DNA-binding NarL/FixJ family response regulator
MGMSIKILHGFVQRNDNSFYKLVSLIITQVFWAVNNKMIRFLNLYALSACRLLIFVNFYRYNNTGIPEGRLFKEHLTNMIKIVIADGQDVYRDNMKSFLSTQKDFEIIGTGKDGYEAIKLTLDLQPDIVLTDIHLPILDGAWVAAILKFRSPATSVIILSDFTNDEDIQRAICSGVAGYLVKASDLDYLARVIRIVYSGDCFLSPKIVTRVFQFISTIATHKLLPIPENNKMPFPKLSAVETMIISHIGQGLSHKEIAEKLKLKQGTIRNHISVILKKTNLRDRTQIAIFAITRGLTSNEEAKVFRDPVKNEVFQSKPELFSLDRKFLQPLPIN